jgi:uncharacterized repeat protein (TIGR03803 family)
MSTFTLSRLALSLGLEAALLSACGGAQPPVGAPAQSPFSDRARTLSSSYQLLYRFPRYSNDGYNPQASLIDVNGTFYGTTMYGGSSMNCDLGCGTVFSLDASGTEKVVYSFTGGSDGAYPAAALLNVSGTLYGTTTEEGGGRASCGTVYTISASGSESILHSFGGGDDGCTPVGPLIDVKGTLYGTTVYGGKGANGTVYSITPGGTEQVLHSFFCNTHDGCVPSGGLISVGGTMYGTTSDGPWPSKCSASSPCGSVYGISTSGSEKVLYAFEGGSDGKSPQGSLVNVNGMLYGTTPQGGGGSRCEFGCGTAYSISTTGTEQVIHRFTGGRDGELPHNLIGVNGTLYGTTTSGGLTPCNVQVGWFDGHGCGTIYRLTTSGREKVLFHFNSEFDGEPAASLLNVNGVLYGTTPQGTTSQGGSESRCEFDCGTAFTFTL